MKQSSHRRLLACLPVIIGLLSACGSSDEAPPAGAADTGATTAVSASPSTSPKQLDDGVARLDAERLGAKVEPVARRGADAPLDSMPDRISKYVGSLLFATGFEEGVSIAGQTSNNGPQTLSGSDRPGYSFPLQLWSPASGWRSWIDADVGENTPMPVAEYATSSIKQVAGRNGPTRALSLHSKAQSPRTAAQQVAVRSTSLGEEPVVFQRMWVKFDAGTLERARAVGSQRFYQTFWEVKASSDFWLRLKLHYDDAKGLYWIAKANGVQADTRYWEARTDDVPVVLAAASEPAGWHKVEIWLDRVGGRFKVAIDGRTLVDRGGLLVGRDGRRIDDYRMMTVSSTVAPLAEVLFDDLEFWNLPPEDAWQR